MSKAYLQFYEAWKETFGEGLSLLLLGSGDKHVPMLQECLDKKSKEPLEEWLEETYLSKGVII